MSVVDPVQTPSGVASLRDLQPADVPAIVDYWTLSPPDYLAAMGVDRPRLGSPDDVHTRYTNAIRTGDSDQSSFALAITLDERMVGYTLLNRYSPDVNYSHWHIIIPGLRTRGLSTALYARRVQAYFTLTPITRLIHQTRTSNTAMNRVLDKFVPVSETKHIDKPDGVAAPGVFHLRFVKREDIPRILARAAELGVLPSPS